MEKRILIVDDEPDLVELLSFHFQEKGWITQPAHNGKEALGCVDSFKPTCILSDINMPELDGLQLLESLEKKGLHIPVVLLTGFRDVKKMQRAWAACAFDFCDKPFDMEKILALMETAHDHGSEYVQTARKRFTSSKKPA